MLISDHINLTDASPIEGAHFVDLTDVYSPRLRAIAKEIDPRLDEGVYVQFRGPHYETPAEVRMAGVLGGDLVGMSTSLEAIAARQSGLEVLGISLVTNPAAGISKTPLNHEEVLDAGREASERCGRLLAAVVGADLRPAMGTAADAPLADLLAAARAWAADDPDAVTRAELEGLAAAAESGDDGRRGRAGRRDGRACSSSAPPGCGAASAAVRTG